MEIINKTTDFRNWEVFLVKGDEDTIREHFNNQYPQNGISVLEHLNNRGTFEITILPKNIIQSVIDLCKSNNWNYQIEPTGVGYENELLIWDENDNEIDLYFDDEDGDNYPDVISWTDGGTINETEDYDVIKKIIENNFVG